MRNDGQIASSINFLGRSLVRRSSSCGGGLFYCFKETCMCTAAAGRYRRRPVVQFGWLVAIERLCISKQRIDPQHAQQ